jgi:phage regulator Rha-like protein
MAKSKGIIAVPDEVIMSKICLIRGKKVMVDRDLAELYDVETKQLKRAVRRNIERFPVDFMFEMTKEELVNWRYQFGTSNTDKMGLRYPPFCFTEHGVLMLASVLNSDRAIQINIQIVKVFTKMREMLLAHKDILLKIEQMQQKLAEHDNNILLIFEYLKQLEQSKQEELEKGKRAIIKGFKSSKRKK